MPQAVDDNLLREQLVGVGGEFVQVLVFRPPKIEAHGRRSKALRAHAHDHVVVTTSNKVDAGRERAAPAQRRCGGADARDGDGHADAEQLEQREAHD